MTIEADFADLMVDTITIAGPTTRNVRGEASYGAEASYRARVVRRNRMVRTDGGDEVASRTQAWVFGISGATVASRVVLPDGTSPPVLAVELYPDENGAHHEVIYFGAGGSMGSA